LVTSSTSSADIAESRCAGEKVGGMANAERAQPTPSSGRGRWGPPPSVHVRYVVVDGPEGDELLRRQLNVIRDILKFLADQEQAACRPGDSEG
jgi:hypothetical protein